MRECSGEPCEISGSKSIIGGAKTGCQTKCAQSLKRSASPAVGDSSLEKFGSSRSGRVLATRVPTIAIFRRPSAFGGVIHPVPAARDGFDDFAIGLLHRNSVHYMIEAFFVLIPLVICSSLVAARNRRPSARGPIRATVRRFTNTWRCSRECRRDLLPL